MNKRVIILLSSAMLCFILVSCAMTNTILQTPLAGSDLNADVTQEHVISKAPSFSIQATISPDDPSVLFFDDFSDNYSGFEQYEDTDGSMGYSDGIYKIFVNQSEYCHWSRISRTFSDVTIRVDAKMLTSTANSEYGVICRLKDDSNFYYLGITSDGYYHAGKLQDDEWVELGNEEYGFNEQVINTGGGINHIKTTCDYDNLSLEVNGDVLVSVSDPDFRTGDVGLYVCTEEPGVEVVFDNFVVTKP